MRILFPDIWSPSQRRGLIVVLAVVILLLAIRLSINRATVPDPMLPRGPNAGQLADRIDPNTATQAQFAEIPEIGDSRAGTIVEYRAQFQAAHPGQRAFTQLKDMQKVKGIGPALAEGMEPYLMFPTASTNPTP